MKKKRIINYLFIFISTVFFCLSNIKAFPNSLGPITQVGVDEATNTSGYFTTLKVSGENIIFCTKFLDTAPIGQTCQINNDWDEKTRYAIAAIIKNANSAISLTGVNEAYLRTELVINNFLYSKGKGGSQVTLLTQYEPYLKVGNDAYNSYEEESKVEINLSTSKLTFTLNGDYYESNEIVVNGVDKYNVDAGIGEYSKTTNGFKIKVKASKITQPTTINVTVSASKTLDQARNYSCGASYQTITPNILDTVTKTASKTISGTINTLGKLTINKVDGDKKHLSGATIKITGSKGYTKTFKTNGTPIVIENLEYDTYKVEELEAPSGYMNNAAKTATLSSTNTEATVELVNTKIKTTFSKLDAAGKKELPGAFLEIQDKDGKVVKLCPGTEEEKYIECSWVSAEIPYVVEGLPIGKYYLVETLAPNGYVINKEKVMFEITGKEANVKVEVKNSLNKVRISKTSIATKKELPGATLEIQDKNGKVVEFCTDSKGLKNKPCTWTSGDKPYEINGMPNGTYYLVETIAPEGYVLNKEKIKFIVDGNKSIVEVEMKNELEVKVPDTLSSRSVLLIVISMFDIALGIGIINYVKKNKIQE